MKACDDVDVMDHASHDEAFQWILKTPFVGHDGDGGGGDELHVYPWRDVRHTADLHLQPGETGLICAWRC